MESHTLLVEMTSLPLALAALTALACASDTNLPRTVARGRVPGHTDVTPHGAPACGDTVIRYLDSKVRSHFNPLRTPCHPRTSSCAGRGARVSQSVFTFVSHHHLHVGETVVIRACMYLDKTFGNPAHKGVQFTTSCFGRMMSFTTQFAIACINRLR